MQYLFSAEPLAGCILYARKHVRSVSITTAPSVGKTSFHRDSPLPLGRCRGKEIVNETRRELRMP